MPLMLFEFGFKAFLQRKRIGGCAGKARKNLVVIKAANFACSRFDDDTAKGDLAITAECNVIATPDADDGRAVKLFHADTLE